MSLDLIWWSPPGAAPPAQDPRFLPSHVCAWGLCPTTWQGPKPKCDPHLPFPKHVGLQWWVSRPQTIIRKTL